MVDSFWLSVYAPASCFRYPGGRAHRVLSCFLLLAYAPDAQVSCFRSLGCSGLGWRGRFFLEMPRLVSMRLHRVLAIRVVVHIGIYRVSFSWLMLPWLF